MSGHLRGTLHFVLCMYLATGPRDEIGFDNLLSSPFIPPAHVMEVVSRLLGPIQKFAGVKEPLFQH